MKIFVSVVFIVFASVMFLYSSNFDSSTGMELITESENNTVNYPDSVLVSSFHAPDNSPRGLAFDGTYLWCANTGDGNSTNGPKIYKLDANTGAILGTYIGPGNAPVGLAWDGEYLWHSDFGTDMVYKIDTATMTSVKSFPSTNDFLMDLAFDGEYLYGACINGPYILKYDTATGNVIDTIFATYSSPNVRPFGLAYLSFTGGQIWTSDGGYGSNIVSQWDLTTTTWFNQWAANPTSYPCGLAYDSTTGNLWVSCWDTDSIYIYDVGINSVEEEITEINSSYSFYTTPISTSINIRFSLQQREYVKIELFNLSGQTVCTLFDGVKDKGTHTLNWNSETLPSGVYFTKFQAGNYSQINRVTIQK